MFYAGLIEMHFRLNVFKSFSCLWYFYQYRLEKCLRKMLLGRVCANESGDSVPPDGAKQIAVQGSKL
jgi:hypothetical protein